MIFTYKPAMIYIQVLRNILPFFISFGTNISDNPYTYIGNVWISPIIWLILSSVNLLVLSIASIYVGFVFWSVLKNKKFVVAESQKMLIILFVIYILFAFFSIISDLSGGLITNSQVRLLPVIFVPAAGLSVQGMYVLTKKITLKNPHIIKIARATALGMFSLLAIFSVIKVTNEPLLNNHWLFYSESEKQSVKWVNDKLLDHKLWVGPRGRYAWVINLYGNTPLDRNRVDTNLIDPLTKYAVLTDIIEMQTIRSNLPLPDVDNADIIFDNGNLKIFYFFKNEQPYAKE
jgi:hypothetical protein